MLLGLAVVASLTQAAPSLAAPPWNAVNVKPELAAFYADALAEALRKQGLKVFTAADISTLLGLERQKQLLGCSDDASNCMVELANALGCDATLVVNGARFDDGSFRGIAKVLGKSGEVLSSAQLDSPDERRLLDSLERAAEPLATPLLPKTERKRSLLLRLWWLPVGLGAVSAGVGTVLLVSARGDYDRVLLAPTRADAEALASKGEGSQTVGWLLAGLGGGLVVTGVVLALWPDAKVVPQVAFAPGGAALGVGGAW